MTKKRNRGFTLIELLVVVLIIGILAAIAVPQYQKAVEKARAMQAITTVDALKKAIEIYVLEHDIQDVTFIGKPSKTSPQAELDIDVSLDCDEDGLCVDKYNNEYWAYCKIGKTWKKCFIGSDRYLNEAREENYSFTLTRQTDGVWGKRCYYEGEKGEQICNSFSSLGWEPEER